MTHEPSHSLDSGASSLAVASPRMPELMVDPLIDRFDLAFLLRKHWKRLVVVPIVVGALAGLFHLGRTPLYESSALLLVDSSLDQLLHSGRIEAGGARPDSAQESLKSLEVTVVADSVALRVIDKLELREAPGFLPADLAEDPNLPDAKLLKFLREKRIKSVLQPETRLINISVFDPEPERARLIAKTFVDEFEAFLADQRRSEIEEVTNALELKVAASRERALEAEKSLREFREANSELPMEQDHDLFSVRLSKVGENLNNAVQNRVEVESMAESISSLDPESDPIEIIEIGGYRDVAHVSASLTALASSRSLLAAAKEQYTETHPSYLSASAAMERDSEQVREIARDIKTTLEARYNAALKKEEHVTRELAALQTQLVELKSKSSEFRAIQEEAEGRWLLHKSLQERLGQSIMSTEMPGNIATVVSEPLTPYDKAGPPLLLFVAAGVVLGCLANVGWLGWRLLAGLPFFTSRQLEERLGLPVIADWSEAKATTRQLGSTARLTQYLKNSQSQTIQISAPGINGTGESVAERIAMFTATSGLRTLIVTVKPGEHHPEITDTAVSGLRRLVLSPSDVTDESRLPSALPRLRREFDKIIIEAGGVDDPTLVSWISRFSDQDVVAVGRGAIPKSEIADRIRHLCPGASLPVGLILVDADKGNPTKAKDHRRKQRREDKRSAIAETAEV
ncbi:MAG: hypothetical protein WD342_18195 [Verrucomicrobiales bacterium]